MNRLIWYLKQLLPLTYVSNYGDRDGQYVCVWRMWFGRCFHVREWLVLRQIWPAEVPGHIESSVARYGHGEQIGGFLGESDTAPCVQRRPCGLPALAWLALGALLLLALLLPGIAWGQQRTVGDCVGEVTRTTIWVGQPVSARVFGVFNPAARWRPFLDGATAYEARYGKGSWSQKGTVVGERWNQAIVEAVLLMAENPCRLPAGYQISRVDREDLILAAIGKASFYDAWIVPRYAAQQTGNKPPPAECPACPKCPTCPPPLPGFEAPTICARARVIYKPGTASTGRLTLEMVGPETCPEKVR